jgi:hypothetical protein
VTGLDEEAEQKAREGKETMGRRREKREERSR